jgi:ArsR family transcriptional regulator
LLDARDGHLADLRPNRRARHAVTITAVAEAIRLEMTPPTDPLAAANVAVLQAVADPVRWAVMATLAEAPRCVCDIQARIPIPSNLLSYHLKVLREAGLVTSSRRGRWVDYAMAEDAQDRMRAALPGALVAVTR